LSQDQFISPSESSEFRARSARRKLNTDLLLLSTGQYYIRNEETFAGRNRREDKSLHPKKSICPTDDAWASWLVICILWLRLGLTFLTSFSGQLEALPNGRYKLLAGGNPTGERNKLLYALPDRRREG
jgi:hypothetical protein